MLLCVCLNKVIQSLMKFKKKLKKHLPKSSTVLSLRSNFENKSQAVWIKNYSNTHLTNSKCTR